MLFSEFREGTGCKDNQHNHEVYKNLEIMYMNSDMTKEEIYEYGKKLVDNSKTVEELELEAQVNAEIANYKRQIEDIKFELERFTDYMNTETDVVWKVQWRDRVRQLKKDLQKCRTEIRLLKWVIA